MTSSFLLSVLLGAFIGTLPIWAFRRFSTSRQITAWGIYALLLIAALVWLGSIK